MAGEHSSKVTNINTSVKPSLSFITEVFNYTGRPITLIHRNGLNETILSQSGPRRGEVQFINRTRASPYVRFNELATDEDVTSGKMRAYLESVENDTAVSGTVAMSYKVTSAELLQGDVYVDDLDVLVTFKGVDSIELPKHPYALSNRTSCVGSRMLEIGTGFSITYVAESTEPVYINYYGIISEVVPVDDAILPPGFYITLYSPDGSKLTQWYEPEKQPFAVFESQAIAEKYDDPIKWLEESTKIELAKSKAEETKLTMALSRLKRELECAADERIRHEEFIKRKYERETDMLKRRLKEREDDIANLRELKTAVVKDTYEERSHERKSTLELIKVAPVLIGGIAALASL